MLRNKSINEQMYFSLSLFIIWLFTSILSMVFNVSVVELIGNIMMVIGFINLLTIFCLMIYSKSVKLPAKSTYRFFGLIEVHIGDKFKSDRDFFRIVAKTVLMAIERNASIVFYTWHVEASTVKRVLGQNVNVVQVSGYERFAQLLLNKHYKADEYRDRYPMIKVVVEQSDLSKEDLKRIDRYAK